MIEWDVPSKLNTPIGDLLVNQLVTDVGYFMVDLEKIPADPLRGIRATKDDVPAGDGEILHRRYANGTELTIPLQLWTTIGPDGEAACGADLRIMLEHLALYVQSILNGRGRWFWTPSEYTDDRMLDECRWLVPFRRDLAGKLTTVTFGVDSPFPYFIDATEQTTSVASGGAAASITNPGNHYMRPVIKVHGPAGSFTIRNESVVDEDGDPLAIVYDELRADPITGINPGDYIEFDTFRETAYLNGNQANRKPWVDPQETDYFYLQPGDNLIVADGADLDVRWNPSWVPA